MYFKIEELAKELEPYFKKNSVQPQEQNQTEFVTIQRASKLFGVTRNFLYGLRPRIKIYKFSSGTKSRSFVKIKEVEALLRPEAK